MDKTSEAILELQPVTFRYKQKLDPQGIPQFGLIAEEVEKVNPDLVARDEQGKPYTVRYDAGLTSTVQGQIQSGIWAADRGDPSGRAFSPCPETSRA